MARTRKAAAKTATTRKRKGKPGRPKGTPQSAAAKKKIAARLKAYWNSAEGKKRRAKGGKKTTARKSTGRAKMAAGGRKGGRKSGKRTVRAKLHYRTKRRSYSVGTRARKSGGKRPVAKRRPMA
jgi:hypothetical protein